MYRLNTEIRLTMLRLRGFELYSRWVPLPSVSVALKIALRSLDHHALQ